MLVAVGGAARSEYERAPIIDLIDSMGRGRISQLRWGNTFPERGEWAACKPRVALGRPLVCDEILRVPSLHRLRCRLLVRVDPKGWWPCQYFARGENQEPHA